MIADFMVQTAQYWLVGLAALFPPVDVPEWMTTVIDALADFLTYANGMGAWVPWTLISVVFATLVTFYVVAFTVKLARAVASYVPFFGGAG